MSNQTANDPLPQMTTEETLTLARANWNRFKATLAQARALARNLKTSDDTLDAVAQADKAWESSIYNLADLATENPLHNWNLDLEKLAKAMDVWVAEVLDALAHLEDNLLGPLDAWITEALDPLAQARSFAQAIVSEVSGALLAEATLDDPNDRDHAWAKALNDLAITATSSEALATWVLSRDAKVLATLDRSFDAMNTMDAWDRVRML